MIYTPNSIDFIIRKEKIVKDAMVVIDLYFSPVKHIPDIQWRF